MSRNKPVDRLDSWKAIANYLGRSVRTARRWEAEEGLPVHRQMHRAQGSVYAYPAEIEAWRCRREQPGPARERPTTATADTERSVAVLPFNYLGQHPGSAYIADGFTEEVITGLSRIRALRVISWTSSMTLRGSGKSARVIGRELGVTRLVEGTVRHDGQRIRVAARLVDAASDDRVWSHSYEGSLDQLFAIQERIAREVVDSLHLQLPADAGSADIERPATDVAAWQCLVQARQAALRWRKDSIDQAVELLRSGLSRSGDDARLHAALGRTYLHYREAGIDLSEALLEQAQSCADKAFALQPGMAAGHQLAGWISYARGEIQSAVDALKTALGKEPGDPDTVSLLANCYLISGRVTEARPLIAKLVAIDPLTPLSRCMPGWADALEGDFESAVGPYRQMFTMDPGNPMARLFFVYALAWAGRTDEARAVAAELPEAMQSSPPGQIIGLFADALAGRPVMPAPSADTAALARATDVFPRFLAQAYALAGAAEEAVAWASVAVDRGFINYPFLARHDPFLATLVGNAAYDQLLERARVRWQSFRP